MTQNKRVVVFSTPTCPHCTHVKRYLKEKGIRFKDVDVSKDSRAAADMVRKTGQKGVPQLWINNRPVVGFDRGKIDTLLNLT
ncbi:MAG: glutathione S-transferase N-terminal domain-containing protein [Bacteroidetes bacterium]|nr:glutathione S-transferase N-terminal domain-containing protein [Bacteroidota bacterium]